MMILEYVLNVAWKKGLENIPEENVVSWVLAIHIISWVLQFVGHGVFESKESCM
jgi:uncharacterized membrane protein YGL010W